MAVAEISDITGNYFSHQVVLEKPLKAGDAF